MAGSSVLSLQVKGLSQLEKGLRNVGNDIIARIEPALRAEAEIELTEAKRRTPVKTGALRASGHVVSVQRGRDSEAKIMYGGPAAGYAIQVHENLEVFHRNGQARFLASVIEESAPFMTERIAARLRMRGR